VRVSGRWVIPVGERNRFSMSWVAMGRAVTLLIDRETFSVVGDTTDNESSIFAKQVTEDLAIREARSWPRTGSRY
jgi:hypothetical protein